MNYIKYFIVSPILIYLLVFLLVYFFQKEIMFPGSLRVDNNSYNTEILTTDNQKIKGFFVDNKSDELIIFFGGNGNLAQDFYKNLQYEKKRDIVIFDYRGYGQSNDKLQDIYLLYDSIDIYNHFKTNHKKVYVVGYSLGTSIASFLASKKEIEHLFLIAPFTKISDVAKSKYPFFPVDFMLKNNFDTIDYLKDYNKKVSIYYASDDEIIKNSLTSKLKDSLKNVYVYKKIKGGHNDIFFDSYFDIYKKIEELK